MKKAAKKVRLDKFLVERRVAKGLSQAEVSKYLNLKSPQYVSNIERGVCSPSLETLNKLIALYDLDRLELISYLVEEYKQEVIKKILRSSKSI